MAASLPDVRGGRESVVWATYLWPACELDDLLAHCGERSHPMPREGLWWITENCVRLVDPGVDVHE